MFFSRLSTNMSYRLLSQESSNEKVSEPEAGHPTNNQITHIGYILLHPGTKITILLIILVLNLLILPISILQLGSSSCVSKHNADNTIHTTLAQDRALQSLDHSYDNLWAELSLNKTSAGEIYVSNGVNKGKGSISM
jgi:hypothetical protein